MHPTNLIPKNLLNAFVLGKKIKHHKFLDNPVVRSGITSTKLFTSILDENTHQEHHLLLKIANKQAFSRSQFPIRAAFANETHFYANIYQALKAYLDDDIAPRLLAYSRKEEEEGLVLDNLKKHGYQNMAKWERLQEDTLTLLMRAYGKLHGSSFALKEKDRSRYWDLSFGYYHISPFDYMRYMSAYLVAVEDTFQSYLKYLDEDSDNFIRKKFLKYARSPATLLISIWSKFDRYSCFLHGNARSNNFMFKFDEKKQPSSVRLVDFALSKIGNPVLDLSSCIYSNSSKSDLENLDDYLSIYHETLCETFEKFGCNYSKLIFSYDILKLHWRYYSKFGLLMALGIMKEQVVGNTYVAERDSSTITDKYVPEFCHEILKRRFKDLLYHMEEIDAL